MHSGVISIQQNPDTVEALLVAGVGFEPTTSGLWARRAAWLLHPAVGGKYTIYSALCQRYSDKLQMVRIFLKYRHRIRLLPRVSFV